MPIYIGTSGWSYDHWKGCFYPEGLAKSHWFEFYSKQFNTVEINATFYHRFTDKTYHKWRAQAPDGFRYVLKTPRLISHRHLLKNVDELISDFTRSAHLLGDKLGQILLQLPPHMPYKPARLEAALCAFKKPSFVAVEFRNENWLTDEIFTLLKDIGANYCNPDYPGHELTDILTGDSGYLRLHGRRKWYADNYPQEELHVIAETAKKLQSHGAKDVYVYFNNDFECFAPSNATALMQTL